jgi:ABC-type bacteriocin/lantibiotic exporter with double-glycine peptidase domain
VDEVRHSRGLESADAGRQWMRENHQTLLSLQSSIDLMLLRNKVRGAIAEAEVQALHPHRHACASLLHLMHAARELGFEALPILSTLDHLKNNHLPALINWKGYHWIVVYAVHDTRVIVADPGQGVISVPAAEFMKSWTRYTLFLRPTQRFAELEESRPTLAQFAPYLTPHRRTLIELGAASLTIQLLAMVLPLFAKFVIDEVIVPQRSRWLAAAVPRA